MIGYGVSFMPCVGPANRTQLPVPPYCAAALQSAQAHVRVGNRAALQHRARRWLPACKHPWPWQQPLEHHPLTAVTKHWEGATFLEIGTSHYVLEGGHIPGNRDQSLRTGRGSHSWKQGPVITYWKGVTFLEIGTSRYVLEGGHIPGNRDQSLRTGRGSHSWKQGRQFQVRAQVPPPCQTAAHDGRSVGATLVCAVVPFRVGRRLFPWQQVRLHASVHHPFHQCPWWRHINGWTTHASVVGGWIGWW
jgi:hypothetical protein